MERDGVFILLPCIFLAIKLGEFIAFYQSSSGTRSHLATTSFTHPGSIGGRISDAWGSGGHVVEERHARSWLAPSHLREEPQCHAERILRSSQLRIGSN